MKKRVGKIVMIVAIGLALGVIGRMDYDDQRADAALSRELKALARYNAKHSPPPLEVLCLVSTPVSQHCTK